MGEFKKFVGIDAFTDALLYCSNGSTGDITTRAYKSTDGTSRTTASMWRNSTYSSDFQEYASPFGALTAYASSDTIDDYDYNAYSVADVGLVTKSKSKTSSSTVGNSVTFTVVVNNNTNSEIKIGSIKFSKMMCLSGINKTSVNVLAYAYFFNDVIPISVGKSRAITVTLSPADFS